MDPIYGDMSSTRFIMEGVCKLGADSCKTRSLMLSPTNIAVENRDIVLVPHPSIGPIHRYGLVGAINGVLCLQKLNEDNFCEFVLCNPLTGQMIETTSPAREIKDGIQNIISLSILF